MSGVLSVLSAIIWGLLLLGVLVFVHEAGHFVAARLNHIRVTEFFLGLPCKWRLAATSKKYGTVYGVTPLLLGGYNQICGMAGGSDEHTPEVLRVISERGSVSVAGIAAELSISEDDVMRSVEALLDWASVEEMDAPEIASEGETWIRTVARDGDGLTVFDGGHDMAKAGSTLPGEPHLIDADPLVAFERERSHTYEGKGFWARASVLVAGVAINIVTGLVLIMFVLSALGVTTAVNTNEVGAVSEGSLAAEAGVKAGDRIVEINGVETGDWTEVGEQLSEALKTGADFTVTVESDGVTTTRDIAQNGVAHSMFGVSAPTELYHVPFLQSAQIAVNYVATTAAYVMQLLQPAHVGEVVSNSTSVVGISVMASEAAAEGLSTFLMLGAAISLSLGFMNLLPIPPLDGGKLVIEIIGVVIRRPVPIRVQTVVSYIGMALFLLLFFILLRQDILRFIVGA